MTLEKIIHEAQALYSEYDFNNLKGKQFDKSSDSIEAQ